MLGGLNVQFTLNLEKKEFNPGERVAGSLKVDITSDVTLTAIRLLVQCKEKAFVRAKREGSSLPSDIKDERTHFKQLFTFFGHTEESGRKGDCELAKGTYEYDYDFTLPTDCVPSVYATGSGIGCSVVWKIRALAVIPNGIDKKLDVVFTVLTTVANAQIMQYNRVLRVLNPATLRLSDANTGCCSSEGAGVGVKASLYPPLIVASLDDSVNSTAAVVDSQATPPPQTVVEEYHLPTMVNASVFRPTGNESVVNNIVVASIAPVQDAQVYNQGQQQQQQQQQNGQAAAPPAPNPLLAMLPGQLSEAVRPNSLTARIGIENLSQKTNIKKVSVTLLQHCLLTVDGYSKTDSRVIGKPITFTPSKGRIGPLESIEFVAVIDIPIPLRSTDAKALKDSALPTLQTAFMITTMTLVVAFPDNKDADEYVRYEAVYLVSSIDYQNRNPPVPAIYQHYIINPERQM